MRCFLLKKKMEARDRIPIQMIDRIPEGGRSRRPEAESGEQPSPASRDHLGSGHHIQGKPLLYPTHPASNCAGCEAPAVCTHVHAHTFTRLLTQPESLLKDLRSQFLKLFFRGGVTGSPVLPSLHDGQGPCLSMCATMCLETHTCL